MPKSNDSATDALTAQVVEVEESYPLAAPGPVSESDVASRKYEHCWLDPAYLAEIDDTTLGEAD